MDKAMPDLRFKLMSFEFKIRDFLRPRKKILSEVGLKPGFHVLDYGCGPGSYVETTSRLVGESGKVFALDIHPLAVERVKNLISAKKLTNVKTILSDQKTGLEGESMDVVLLYDILHDLSDPAGVLKELHRVLKPSGILSVSDHHLKEPEIVSGVTGSNLFHLSQKNQYTYSFRKT